MRGAVCGVDGNAISRLGATMELVVKGGREAICWMELRLNSWSKQQSATLQSHSSIRELKRAASIVRWCGCRSDRSFVRMMEFQ